ncbi:PREDICTED: low-density lipoprotein receptor class A domain-containing protein 1-like [Galeopterus variegatus]|uniref:Low-density lipoprotein receptor class A domain-containing protein 1-like n=1 Tax=Galeopterus variegatus TaxID=482537 RepID=A0ABM0QT54_GALVR|nr:PREDICTED: low-density lipoprotein receptor class A domain-containing protein 1-like [Galeopterus variegatus]
MVTGERINIQYLSLPDLPYRKCKTALQQQGFLCGDLTTCLPPSLLCDGKLDCSHGEDESATYCVLQCPKFSGWRCDTVFFADCACIPRTQCKNGIQDCAHWTDENLCE